MKPVPGTLMIGYPKGRHRQANDPHEREMLVDVFLAGQRENSTLILDFRAGTWPPQKWGGSTGKEYTGHLNVGISCDVGAAVFYQIRENGQRVTRETLGSDPPSEPTGVIFDDRAAMYFLRNRIVPKDFLRALMAECALTGDIAETVELTDSVPEAETFEPGTEEMQNSPQEFNIDWFVPDSTNTL